MPAAGPVYRSVRNSDSNKRVTWIEAGEIRENTYIYLKFVFIRFSRILPLDEFFYLAKSCQIFNFSLFSKE